MPIVDPKVKIQTLLDANWIDANSNNQAVKIHTGWYNAAWNKKPQVTVTGAIISVIRGGETGITAIGGAGLLVRLMQCNLKVNVWAHAEMTTSGGAEFRDSGINAKDITYNMASEVQRIIEANMFTDSELEFMTWLGKDEIVDTRIQPVVQRYSNSIRLVWKESF